MGLFSSKYVTTVNTAVSRAVDDALIISSAETGLIAALLVEQDDQLVENVLESLISSIGVKAGSMYSYAKKHYPVGLPSSKVSSVTDGKAVVLAVLKTLVSPNIVEKYYRFGPLNSLHYGWVTLVNTYEYSSVTNEIATLSAQVGYPCYLEDMVMVIKEASVTELNNGSLAQWGTAAKTGYTPRRAAMTGNLKELVPPTPFRLDPDAVEDYVIVKYVWAVPTPTVINGTTVTRNVIHEGSFNISVSALDPLQDYFHVKYLNGTQEGYWIYQLGAGTYPEIDSIFTAGVSTAGAFFPIVYFRQASNNMGTNKTTAEYKAAKRMMKTLGVDYQEIIDAVHENPGIADVEQAMMMFAVPANTQNSVEQKYLFDFFTKLYLAAGGVSIDAGWGIGNVTPRDNGSDNYAFNLVLSTLANIARNTPPKDIRIEIKDTRFNMALSCAGIYKRKSAGVIGAVNAYASTFTSENVTVTYTKKEIVGYTQAIGDNGGSPIYADVPYSDIKPVDVFVYKKQITNTVYEEIVVFDLKMTYYMWGGYTTVGDDLGNILLVPLDKAITAKYSIPDRELLYTRSLHYVFNSRTVQKVKWYQQGWFADLVTVVGIVLTVLSLGADGGFFANTAAVLAGKITIAAYVASLLVIAQYYVLILVASKVFVKVLGDELAMLIAIATTLYVGYQGMQTGSIKGAPWASELLALSNGLTTEANAVMGKAFKTLQSDYENLTSSIKERTEALDKANDLLNQRTLLRPEDIVYGQTPTEFYNTRIHSGNIGILGIDSIASFVDIALTLPKLNDTLEGRSYA